MLCGLGSDQGWGSWQSQSLVDESDFRYETCLLHSLVLLRYPTSDSGGFTVGTPYSTLNALGNILISPLKIREQIYFWVFTGEERSHKESHGQ